LTVLLLSGVVRAAAILIHVTNRRQSRLLGIRTRRQAFLVYIFGGGLEKSSGLASHRHISGGGESLFNRAGAEFD